MSEVGGSPLLCSPADKAEREAANGVRQLDYLTDLIVGERAIADVREMHVLDLQRLAIDGVYPCGGRYRDARDKITISDSEHEPPPSALVRTYVLDLLEYINSTRGKLSALDRAAYALWRLNWIHPFRGGNGRTSRCIAYLIICLDLGMMVPGIPTLPTLIYDRRDDYVKALKAADASQRAALVAVPEQREPVESHVDLSEMTTYLRDLVTQQMANAIAKLALRSH